MAEALIDINKSEVYLSASDYIQAFQNGEAKSTLSYLSTSLINFIPEQTFKDYSLLSYINLPNCTLIGDGAFENCVNLKEINCQNVEEISATAFMSCYSLEYANIINCKQITNSAFEFCSNLSEVLLNNVDFIGSDTFYNCFKLSDINLNSCLYIGDYAFYRCSNLNSFLDIPLCSYIGSNAFESCINIEQVSLLWLSSLGNSVFKGCSSLKTIYFGHLNMHYSEYGSYINFDDIFSECNNLESICLDYITGTSNLSQLWLRNISAFIVLPSILRLDTICSQVPYSSMFGDVHYLDLPNLSIVTNTYGDIFSGIHYRTFSDVTILKASELYRIEDHAFHNCNTLLEVSLPNCTYIGNSVFMNTDLKYLDLPKCTYVGRDALNFYNSYANYSISYIKLNALSYINLFYSNSSTTNVFITAKYPRKNIIGDIYLNSLNSIIMQYIPVTSATLPTYTLINGSINNLYLNGFKSRNDNEYVSSIMKLNQEGGLIVNNLYMKNLEYYERVVDNSLSTRHSSYTTSGDLFFNGSIKNVYIDNCSIINIYETNSGIEDYISQYGEIYNYSYNRIINTHIANCEKFYAPKMERMYMFFSNFLGSEIVLNNLMYGKISISTLIYSAYSSLSSHSLYTIENINLPKFEGTDFNLYYTNIDINPEGHKFANINIKGGSNTLIYVYGFINRLSILSNNVHGIDLTGYYHYINLSNLKTVNSLYMNVYVSTISPTILLNNIERIDNMFRFQIGAPAAYSSYYFEILSLSKISYIGRWGSINARNIYAPNLTTIGSFYGYNIFSDIRSLTIGISQFNKGTLSRNLSFVELKYLSASNLINLENIACPVIEEVHLRNFNSSITGIVNKSYLKIVDIPNCESIKDYAFSGCSQLSYLSLLNCTYIGSAAFMGCSNLSFLALPNCSYIGPSALYNTGITLIELGYGSVLSYTMFSRYSDIIIKVPASLYSAYQADSGWMALSSRGIFIVSS